jgi:hypothetical protein
MCTHNGGRTCGEVTLAASDYAMQLPDVLAMSKGRCSSIRSPKKSQSTFLQPGETQLNQIRRVRGRLLCRARAFVLPKRCQVVYIVWSLTGLSTRIPTTSSPYPRHLLVFIPSVCRQAAWRIPALGTCGDMQTCRMCRLCFQLSMTLIPRRMRHQRHRTATEECCSFPGHSQILSLSPFFAAHASANAWYKAHMIAGRHTLCDGVATQQLQAFWTHQQAVNLCNLLSALYLLTCSGSAVVNAAADTKQQPARQRQRRVQASFQQTDHHHTARRDL